MNIFLLALVALAALLGAWYVGYAECKRYLIRRAKDDMIIAFNEKRGTQVEEMQFLQRFIERIGSVR
jgi:phage-related minor tail protein